MTFSMTGFGRGEVMLADRHMIVEMKSVNNKYADFQIRLPRVLAVMETKIRKTLSDSFKRGKIDVFINFTDLTPDSTRVICDTALAEAYVRSLRQIAEHAQVPEAVNAAVIARFPDVLRVESAQIDTDEVWQHLLEPALDQAVNQMKAMRSQEGRQMVIDINRRLVSLGQLQQVIEQHAPAVPAAYRDRLNNRLNILLGERASELFDEQRLAAEVALFADKCAIDEELVRLKSHLQQFTDILEATGPIGKKLDFLVQEINREINTIGSKANDLNLTNQVVQMKSELEKIREQVQNME